MRNIFHTQTRQNFQMRNWIWQLVRTHKLKSNEDFISPIIKQESEGDSSAISDKVVKDLKKRKMHVKWRLR